MLCRFLRLCFLVLTPCSPTALFAKTYEVGGCTTCNCLLGSCATLDSALIHVTDGDRIHVAGGTYTAPPGGWRISKSIELFGDGAGDKAGGATRLKANDVGHAPSGPVLVLDTNTKGGSSNLENVYIHDLQLREDDVPSHSIPGQYGITISWGARNQDIENLSLARLYIANMGDDGIHLVGSLNPFVYVQSTSITDVNIQYCRGFGLALYNLFGAYLLGGHYTQNYLGGAYTGSTPGIRFIGGTYETNNLGAQGKAQLQIDTSDGFLVEGCHFEAFDDRGPGAIRLDNDLGGYIGSCFFVNTTSPTGGAYARGILLSRGTDPPKPPSSVTGIVIGPNSWWQVNTLIEFDDTDSIRANTVLPQSVHKSTNVGSRIIIPEAVNRGNIVYPSTSNTSNVTAGIVIPRLSGVSRDAMTTVSSGGTRREGLVVYNDAAKVPNYFNGSAWTSLVPFFQTKTTSNAPPAGIAFPLVASATRDSLPASFKVEGALIYNNTTHEFNYWNGTAWQGLTAKNP